MASSPTVTPIAVRLPSEVPTGAIATPVAADTQTRGGARKPDAERTKVSGVPAETSAAVGELVDVLKSTSISLRFEIDDITHRVITKVVDKETGELIRQMPTVEVLRIARAMDKLQGLFVSQAV
ncbi:flagellar protein FlaG [Cupriavidus sp. WKF15]|uniref:flagellar protein FlaG n=1 Tax=Cupriavidus sp. WKF15 TaxID=3032282 RepID=UPI0023E10B26|nr:flagellar protein FlaG [Cupriavidus sp. WKF15]WER49347.1 flagellar protein FlaG [Cupriavidus sp. WKF15]